MGLLLSSHPVEKPLPAPQTTSHSPSVPYPLGGKHEVSGLPAPTTCLVVWGLWGGVVRAEFSEHIQMVQ